MSNIQKDNKVLEAICFLLSLSLQHINLKKYLELVLTRLNCVYALDDMSSLSQFYNVMLIASQTYTIAAIIAKHFIRKEPLLFLQNVCKKSKESNFNSSVFHFVHSENIV